MYILGVSCFYHDAAAVLLQDGMLLAAAEEERFSRIKHDWVFHIALSSSVSTKPVLPDAIWTMWFFTRSLCRSSNGS